MANPAAMKVINVLACTVLLLSFLAEGQPNGPKPKKVKCQDKNYPQCYHVKMLCPNACPRKCEVDCVTCKPVCDLSPPSSSPNPSEPPSPSIYTPPPTFSTPPPMLTPPASPPPKLTPPPTSTPPPRLTPPPVSTPPKLAPPPVSTPPSSPVLTPPAVTPPAISTPPSSPIPTPPTVTPPAISTPPSSPVPTPPATTPPAISTPPSSPVPTPPTVTPPTISTPPSSPVPTPPVVTPPTVSTPPSVPSFNYTPPPTNWPPEVSGKRVFCKNRNYPNCYRMEQRCPAACPDQCEVDCVTCSPVCDCNRPGAVCQDPRFVGADGITFYFHGKKDKDFCIVSDSNIHINAHFIGRRNMNMKRDFTWIQSLGILFDNNQIFVGAKKTATWNNAVDRLNIAFNGHPIFLSEVEGAKWEPNSAPGVSITRSRDTNVVVIEVEGNFRIKATVVPITQKESQIHKYGIHEEDCFAHLDLSFKFFSLTGVVNGVLGQTYASNYVNRAKMGVNMPVLGGNKEFSSSNIFSTDCVAARFTGTTLISSKNFEYANLKCVSGLTGRGVVCRR